MVEDKDGCLDFEQINSTKSHEFRKQNQQGHKTFFSLINNNT